MTYKLNLFGPREKLKVDYLNVTSRSKDWARAFSPFMNQGPITIGSLTSKNVENLWQSSKRYPIHRGKYDEWCAWRDSILQDEQAHRYPMGKGAKPDFSFLDGKKLTYIEARKAIYIPAYFQKLELYCMTECSRLAEMLEVGDVWLWDFDGRITDQTWDEIVDDATKPLGHCFLIKKFMFDKFGIGGDF